MVIEVTVAYATPNQQWEIPLSVENNCTVALAIRRSGILQQCPEIDLSRAKVGIYSRVVKLDAALLNGDRIEVYRPLKVDPKQARKERAIGMRRAKQVCART